MFSFFPIMVIWDWLTSSEYGFHGPDGSVFLPNGDPGGSEDDGPDLPDDWCQVRLPDSCDHADLHDVPAELIAPSFTGLTVNRCPDIDEDILCNRCMVTPRYHATAIDARVDGPFAGNVLDTDGLFGRWSDALAMGSELTAIDREMLVHGAGWLVGDDQLRSISKWAMCVMWNDGRVKQDAKLRRWIDEVITAIDDPSGEGLSIRAGETTNGLLSQYDEVDNVIVVNTRHGLWRQWRFIWQDDHEVFEHKGPWAGLADGDDGSDLLGVPCEWGLAPLGYRLADPYGHEPTCDGPPWYLRVHDRVHIGRSIAADLIRTFMDWKGIALPRQNEDSLTPKRQRGVSITDMGDCDVPGFRAGNGVRWLLDRIADTGDKTSFVAYDLGERPLQRGPCVFFSDFFHVWPTMCNTMRDRTKRHYFSGYEGLFCDPLF